MSSSNALRCLLLQASFLSLAGLGLARPGVDATPPVFVQQPTLLPNPNPEVPLSALVALQADEPVRVMLSYWDGQQRFGPFNAQPTFSATHDSIPVLSLRPSSTYRIFVTIFDAAGNSTTAPAPLVFDTPALPAGFPPLDVTTSIPSGMEPGVTMISPRESRANNSWLILLDEQGEVVWYYASPPGRRLGDVRRAPSGNLLAIINRDTITEFDMLGNVVGEWQAVGVHTTLAPGAVPVLTDSFHHEVITLPEADAADFAAISVELRDYPDYPADESDPTQLNPMTTVAADTIVEFKRDGTVVREFRLLDMLDPYRISYGSLAPFWNPHYGLMGTADWAHANAVILDEEDDAYIVSLRSQDAIVKFSRQTQEVLWIMGDPAGWQEPWASKLLSPEPGQPEFNWQYHQHAPELTQNGTLIFFDNGNGRAIAPAPELPDSQRASRAIEVSIDEQALTLRQEWSYHRNVDGPWYSSFLGDADRLTNSVLVTDGGKFVTGTEVGYARIVEVTYAFPPQKVFEVIIRDPNPTAMGAVGWSAYRSEKLRGVYPF